MSTTDRPALEIDLSPYLSAGEIDAYRRRCADDGIPPAAGLEKLIRAEVRQRQAELTLNLSIPPELTAKLALRAAENNVTSSEMAGRIILEAVEAIEAAETPPPEQRPNSPEDSLTLRDEYNGNRAGIVPPVTLDIAPMLTPEERKRLDDLAIRHGASPEALTAATVRRLLKRTQVKPQTFRLRMPEQAKRKLQEHAQALGCGAGELAAFLFSRRQSRPAATLAGG